MELEWTQVSAWTFGLLTLALVGLWLPDWRLSSGTRVAPWPLALAAAAGCAAAAGFVDWRGFLALGFLALGCRWSYAGLPRSAHYAAVLATLVLAGALEAHLMPGFANPRVVDGAVLSPGAVPYTKHLNFDKAAAGLLLIALAGSRLTGARNWLRVLAKAGPPVAALIVAVLAASFALGYVRWDPGRPPGLLFWAWTNLFFTCVAEEALFRGFLQGRLAKALEGFRAGSWLALVVAAAAFGVAHLAGGWRYVLLATLAGLGYGWVYQRTGRVEASILAHFGLNLAHFCWFTYPALASAL